MPDLSPAQSAALIGGIERLTGDVSGLRTDLQALVQGLTLMAEAQATQTEMLQQVLVAASQEPPAENPMETLVQDLTRALDRLTAGVAGMERTVGGLSQRIGTAIIRGASPTVSEPAPEDGAPGAG
jgi:hypothetical protein